MGFYGHAYATATYVARDPVFGWLAFGANLREDRGVLHVTPKDSARTRLFVAPSRTWITLEAGKIAGADIDIRSGAITLQLAPRTPYTPTARVIVEQNGTRSEHRVTLGDAPTTWTR